MPSSPSGSGSRHPRKGWHVAPVCSGRRQPRLLTVAAADHWAGTGRRLAFATQRSERETYETAALPLSHVGPVPESTRSISDPSGKIGRRICRPALGHMTSSRTRSIDSPGPGAPILGESRCGVRRLGKPNRSGSGGPAHRGIGGRSPLILFTRRSIRLRRAPRPRPARAAGPVQHPNGQRKPRG